jgi:hypothetical protein
MEKNTIEVYNIKGDNIIIYYFFLKAKIALMALLSNYQEIVMIQFRKIFLLTIMNDLCRLCHSTPELRDAMKLKNPAGKVGGVFH